MSVHGIGAAVCSFQLFPSRLFQQRNQNLSVCLNGDQIPAGSLVFISGRSQQQDFQGADQGFLVGIGFGKSFSLSADF